MSQAALRYLETRIRPLTEAKLDLVTRMIYLGGSTLEVLHREGPLVPGPPMDLWSPPQTWPAILPLNKTRSGTSVIEEFPTESTDRASVASRCQAKDLHPSDKDGARPEGASMRSELSIAQNEAGSSTADGGGTVGTKHAGA